MLDHIRMIIGKMFYVNIDKDNDINNNKSKDADKNKENKILFKNTNICIISLDDEDNDKIEKT